MYKRQGKGTYSQNGTPVEVDVQGVQQNVCLLYTSSPSAGKEAVIAAAEAAQCHDFIERLPDG